MYSQVKSDIEQTLQEIEQAGLFKNERPISSSQSVSITTAGKSVLNFCANNYLGLSDDPSIISAAKKGLEDFGFGMSSVRFICGTQTQHKELEKQLSNLLRTEATILFPSCFDANGGVFEVLLNESDAVISDELNHASIIDGIRLCKAERFRYRNRDLNDLEVQLQKTMGHRRRLIVTDGVFSMDGSVAPLPEICDLAEKYQALVMVDDSHAVGFLGASGAGTPELMEVSDRIDILTGTLGKALGGASGGYVSSRKEIVELLRQRARPYLFSNSVPPSVVAGSLQALAIVRSQQDRRTRLTTNAQLFRTLMTEAGFTLLPGHHPIIPVMFKSEREAVDMAAAMLELGIFVVAFSYPVVPMGKARIRVQISSSHTESEIKECVEAFVESRNLISR